MRGTPRSSPRWRRRVPACSSCWSPGPRSSAPSRSSPATVRRSAPRAAPPPRTRRSTPPAPPATTWSGSDPPTWVRRPAQRRGLARSSCSRWPGCCSWGGCSSAACTPPGRCAASTRSPRRATSRRSTTGAGSPTRWPQDGAEQARLLEEGEARNAIVECWHRFEVQAARAGLGRRPAETSSELALRMLDAADVDRAAVTRLLELYREARFSGHDVAEDDRAARARRPRPHPGRVRGGAVTGLQLRALGPARPGARGRHRRGAGGAHRTGLRPPARLVGAADDVRGRHGVAAAGRQRRAGRPTGATAGRPRCAPTRARTRRTARLVHGHLDAGEPGPALRDRLVALARQPATPSWATPTCASSPAVPVRRLSPAESTAS